MNITTNREIMIFRRDGNFGPIYSCAVSEKQQDGAWLRTFINVRFRKGIELADRSMIKITKGWLKPTKDNGIILFVSEYEQTGEVVEKNITTFKAEDLDDPNFEFPF